MVAINFLVGIVAAYVSFTAALPMPDSAIGNEVGVSAPDGTPVSNTKEM